MTKVPRAVANIVKELMTVVTGLEAQLMEAKRVIEKVNNEAEAGSVLQADMEDALGQIDWPQ